jgi:hypothetical protein
MKTEQKSQVLQIENQNCYPQANIEAGDEDSSFTETIGNEGEIFCTEPKLNFLTNSN